MLLTGLKISKILIIICIIKNKVINRPFDNIGIKLHLFHLHLTFPLLYKISFH